MTTQRSAPHPQDIATADPFRPSPPSGPRDARALRSAEALRGAMLALLEHKPLEQITIREIARAAGVSYATFFRHHPTKDSLLDDVAADQIDRLVRLSLPMFDRAESHASVVAMCTYVSDHRSLWTTLLTGGAAGAMRAELLRISRRVAIGRAPEKGWIPLELGVNCSVSLIFETLAWWLAQPVGQVAIEEVAGTLHRLLASLQFPDAGGVSGSGDGA